MKKTLSLLLLLVLIIIPARAADVQDVKPTKNVILFISDGTSLATVRFQQPAGCNGILIRINRI